MIKSAREVIAELAGEMAHQVTTESITLGAEIQRKNTRAQDLGPEYEDILTLEVDGGPCPRCGMMWKKIEVKNPYANFTYYDPACSCYGRCKEGPSVVWKRVRDKKDRVKEIPTKKKVMTGCGSSLHREKILGVDRCMSCGKVFDERKQIEDHEKESGLDQYAEQYK